MSNSRRVAALQNSSVLGSERGAEKRPPVIEVSSFDLSNNEMQPKVVNVVYYIGIVVGHDVEQKIRGV